MGFSIDWAKIKRVTIGEVEIKESSHESNILRDRISESVNVTSRSVCRHRAGFIDFSSTFLTKITL
jgi:hypothetical protein